MTQEGFNGLPLLLTRAEVVECGIPERALADLKFVVKADAPTAPPGRIGWVEFNGKQGKYRKADVAVLVGLRVR